MLILKIFGIGDRYERSKQLLMSTINKNYILDRTCENIINTN